NHKIKTAGMVNFSDLVLEKVKALPNSDTSAWDWLRQAQNVSVGGGLLAANYKRNIVVKEMDTTGLNTVNSYVLTGCWIKKISNSDFDRTSSDNSIETITISVDTMEKL